MARNKKTGWDEFGFEEAVASGIHENGSGALQGPALQALKATDNVTAICIYTAAHLPTFISW